MPSTLDKLQRPIHDLRISVIDRCNFRCPYCMPEAEYSQHYSFLKPKDWLAFHEIERLTKLFVSLGVQKVRITGGEPLLRPDISLLITKLYRIPEINDLTLTTNGALLLQHAKPLKQAGLKRLTVSLDSLDPHVFEKMSGGKGSLDEVLEGIVEAEQAGFESIKINVVVQKGLNDRTILDLVKHFRGTKHILRFIEYMDVGNCNHWDQNLVVPSAEIVAMINEVYPIQPVDPQYFGEVAQRYTYEDGAGEIGFISSVSQPFCQSCTRVRLSTNGQIYTCLFADVGADIRTPLRNGASDEELLNFIKNVWNNREDRYSELRSKIHASHQESHKVEMFQIGG